MFWLTNLRLYYTVLQSEDEYDKKDYTTSVKMSRRSLCWIKAAVIFYIIGVIFYSVYIYLVRYYSQKAMQEMFEEHDAALMQQLVQALAQGTPATTDNL